MGMAKERGRLEGERCRWCRNRVEHKHGEGHHDVPRFGALRRDNTPTPACMLDINDLTNYNQCSWSCFIGRRDLPWAWFSPASLRELLCEVNANGVGGSYSMSSGYFD